MQSGKVQYFNKDGQLQTLNLMQMHIEQDTAKSLHDVSGSLLDYNRSGVPLIEIVTEPEITHPTDGKNVIQEIQDLLRDLGISEANMEEG